MSKRKPRESAADIPEVRFPPPLLNPHGYDKAITEAYNGNAKRLCAYLRSDKDLSAFHRDVLAELIYRGLHQKGRGRPRGSTSRLQQGSGLHLGRAMEKRITDAI